ncbi:MAG: hypothetical protein U9Q68_03550, partial [Euryarchaeota archaeon]|nr:hypothetical protein [Euryarchaeota archaeon]
MVEIQLVSTILTRNGWNTSYFKTGCGGVSFTSAGLGNAGLITAKGKRLIEDANMIIYSGSSIYPEILEFSDGKK